MQRKALSFITYDHRPGWQAAHPSTFRLLNAALADMGHETFSRRSAGTQSLSDHARPFAS